MFSVLSVCSQEGGSHVIITYDALDVTIQLQGLPLAVADLNGAPPPGGLNSFNFMQFWGKFGKIVCWRPPRELAPPPRGNPGSAIA